MARTRGATHTRSPPPHRRCARLGAGGLGWWGDLHCRAVAPKLAPRCERSEYRGEGKGGGVFTLPKASIDLVLIDVSTLRLAHGVGSCCKCCCWYLDQHLKSFETLFGTSMSRGGGQGRKIGLLRGLLNHKRRRGVTRVWTYLSHLAHASVLPLGSAASRVTNL